MLIRKRKKDVFSFPFYIFKKINYSKGRKKVKIEHTHQSKMTSTSSPLSKLELQFQQRKEKLLAGLQSKFRDSSPKGSVDTEIFPLVNHLNQYAGIVTTSSCAGRMACYLEGTKKPQNVVARLLSKSNGTTTIDSDDDEDVEPGELQNELVQSSYGGKGAGGRWLYVSHAPMTLEDDTPIFSTLFDQIPTFKDPIDIYDTATMKTDPSTRFVRLKFEPMVIHPS